MKKTLKRTLLSLVLVLVIGNIVGCGREDGNSDNIQNIEMPTATSSETIKDEKNSDKNIDSIQDITPIIQPSVSDVEELANIETEDESPKDIEDSPLQEENKELHGFKYTNAGIIVPLENGTYVKLDEDIKPLDVWVSKNRQYYLYETNEKLFYTESATDSNTDSIMLTDNVSYVQYLNDESIIYSDKKENYYRFSLSDLRNVKFGSFNSDIDTLISIIFGSGESKDEQCLTYIVDGALYCLYLGNDIPEKKCDIMGEGPFTVLYVSNDGEKIIWTCYNKETKTETIYYYHEGAIKEIGTFDVVEYDTYLYSDTELLTNVTNSFFVIYNKYDSKKFYIVPNIDTVLDIYLPTGNPSKFYTAEGNINTFSGDYSGLYVLLRIEDYDQLYYIDIDGQREKVLSDVRTCVIENGRIYYIDKENVFKKGKIYNDSISDTKVIDENVYSLYIKNSYVYFTKDYDSNNKSASLFGQDKKGGTTLIDTNIATENVYLGYTGDTIYYLKDVTSIPNVIYRSDIGVLYKYRCTLDKAEKIASDVILRYVGSGYTSGNINDNSFYYLKYSKTQKGTLQLPDGTSYEHNDVLCDWYYFDGKEKSLIVKDIEEPIIFY